MCQVKILTRLHVAQADLNLHWGYMSKDSSSDIMAHITKISQTKQLQNQHNGKCPKISYTKSSDKMAHANSVDPDKTAPEGAV